MGYLMETESIFEGSESCSNAKYSFYKFSIPEIFKGTVVTPEQPNCSILIDVARDRDKVRNLQPYQKYQLTLDVGIEAARTDANTGKSYNARTKFSLISATLVTEDSSHQLTEAFANA